MQTKSSWWKVAALVIIAAILTGCSASATPTVQEPTATLAPTATPLNLEPTLKAVEGEAVQTVVALLTQNAPTNTPIPTETSTPSVTDTPVPPTTTATNVFIPWTKTPTASPLAYSCTVTNVEPKASDTIKVKQDFDGKWTVKNTGTETLKAGDLDVRYSSGTKFQKSTDVVDLPNDMAPNGTATIVVDMVAPENDGTYTTAWSIALPDGTSCALNMTINVTK